MPLKITKTSRKLKNKSGIDIRVPGYQKADSPRNVKDYHVVVITRLIHYKLPAHDKDDVVHFMVPRDYAAFEKLQKEILEAFPELKLPDLPRKFHLFMSNSDLDERQISFDCLMSKLALNYEMATSIPMLQFLGFDLLADKKYLKDREQFLKNASVENSKTNDESDDDDMFGEETATEEDLFGDDKVNGKKKQPTEGSMFEENGKDPAVVLLDKDIEPEILAAPDGEGEKAENKLFIDEEDHSDLLNVRESIDDVLNISGKKSKSKASSRPGPSRPAPTSLFGDEDEGKADDMGTDDIMNYIAQQNTNDDDDLDLF